MLHYLWIGLVCIGAISAFYAYLLLTAEPQPESMEEPTFSEEAVVASGRIETEERTLNHIARPVRFVG